MEIPNYFAKCIDKIIIFDKILSKARECGGEGMERADIAIIGTGPAGVSAAITATIRNKRCCCWAAGT